MKSLCLTVCVSVLFSVSASAEDWPQWRGPGRDGVWRETGIVEKFESSELPIKWRAKIGAGYSGPTVADARVFVTDRLARPKSVERIHCFDEHTGDKIWSHEYECSYDGIGYDAGPRASVTIDNGKAYSLGAAGHLFCLDAASGKISWQKDLRNEYDIEMPNWGIAASPLVWRDLVIMQISGRDACIVALNKNTGEEAWKALADRGQYSAPILVEQANQPVVVCWTGDSVTGLAPDSGKSLWRYAWRARKMPIGVATPVHSGDRLFFTSFYDGSLMLRLTEGKVGQAAPAVEKVWQRVGRNENPGGTDALQSIISTPVFDGTHVYGVDSYGELRCLNAATGDRLWEDLSATPMSRWSTIHFVKNGDRYFLFNERGELIIGRLSPEGFTEISRAKLLAPTTEQLRQRGGVCWSHPAFANRHILARNDNELVCASLAAKE